MIRVTVSSDAPDPRAIAQAVEVLARGWVVAYPTDTLYGLAVDPRSDDALREAVRAEGEGPRRGRAAHRGGRLRRRGRPAGLAAGELRLAAAFWPGPLSIVVPARPAISRVALGGGHDGRDAGAGARRSRARWPPRFGFCITATSANPSRPPPASQPTRRGRSLGERRLLIDGGSTRRRRAVDDRRRRRRRVRFSCAPGRSRGTAC